MTKATAETLNLGHEYDAEDGIVMVNQWEKRIDWDDPNKRNFLCGYDFEDRIAYKADEPHPYRVELSIVESNHYYDYGFTGGDPVLEYIGRVNMKDSMFDAIAESALVRFTISFLEYDEEFDPKVVITVCFNDITDRDLFVIQTGAKVLEDDDGSKVAD